METTDCIKEEVKTYVSVTLLFPSGKELIFLVDPESKLNYFPGMLSQFPKSLDGRYHDRESGIQFWFSSHENNQTSNNE
jgi:hypothetical protein